MRDCDTNAHDRRELPYSQYLPEFDHARAVQINIDPTVIGMRYPFEVNLLGDAKATLQALLPRLRRKTDRLGGRGARGRDCWEVMERRARTDADPVNPERVFHELSPQLPDTAIITADSGSVANWYARHLKMHEGMRCSLSGTLATLGAAAAYASGAKFAHPDRLVIALVGDGAMQMNGINELITIGQHWREWSDPRVVVGVRSTTAISTRSPGSCGRWAERRRSSPRNDSRTSTTRVSRAARVLAEFGSKTRATSPMRGARRWSRQPCLVEFVTDPTVPPIPPQADCSQAESMAAALLKGDPEAWSLVKEGVKAKAQDFLRRRH